MSVISATHNLSMDTPHDEPASQQGLSSRLSYALNALKISQSELARKLDIKPQAIQYICANNVKKSRFTFEIAEALDISYTWLSVGKGHMLHTDQQSQEISSHRIPILNERQWTDHHDGCLSITDSNISDWTVTNMPTSATSLALTNNEDAMSPAFPKNTILIFDTELKPNNFDFVLAYIASSDKLLFRQYVKIKDSVILKPIDQTLYKDYPLKKEDIIYGILTQTHYSLR